MKKIELLFLFLLFLEKLKNIIFRKIEKYYFLKKLKIIIF